MVLFPYLASVDTDGIVTAFGFVQLVWFCFQLWLRSVLLVLFRPLASFHSYGLIVAKWLRSSVLVQSFNVAAVYEHGFVRKYGFGRPIWF